MWSAFRGPAHQLAVRMRINNFTHGHDNNYGPARTSMWSAFRGPAHQLAVRMRINNFTHGHDNNYGPSNQPCTMRQQLHVRRGFAL